MTGGRVALVTGQSGAGKASILRALEDLGFEAIDNPPLPLIEALVARCDCEGGRMAIGVDARTSGFDATAVLAAVERLRQRPRLRLDLVFALADEAVLLRRYTETRRRHPLSPGVAGLGASAPGGRVIDGIRAEQTLVDPLRQAADILIDTTDLPLPELRQLVERRFGAEPASAGRRDLSVGLISFAFPGGLPREADMVFDARFLKNPHYVSELKALTGLDAEVSAHVGSDPDYAAFMNGIVSLLSLLLPRFQQEGKKYATIAVGCTGGRHRSVRVVEDLAGKLIEDGWRVVVTHRELARAERVRQVGGEMSRMSPLPIQAQEA